MTYNDRYMHCMSRDVLARDRYAIYGHIHSVYETGARYAYKYRMTITNQS